MRTLKGDAIKLTGRRQCALAAAIGVDRLVENERVNDQAWHKRFEAQPTSFAVEQGEVIRRVVGHHGNTVVLYPIERCDDLGHSLQRLNAFSARPLSADAVHGCRRGRNLNAGVNQPVRGFNHLASSSDLAHMRGHDAIVLNVDASGFKVEYRETLTPVAHLPRLRPPTDNGRLRAGVLSDAPPGRVAPRLVAMPGTFVYPERLAQLQPVAEHALLADCETAWWTYEPAEHDRWSGDTVIAVHGFRGDHHGLELFAAFWPEQRFVIPDLPGFGASSAFGSTPHSIEAYAAWLRAFVDHVRPEGGRLIVLGHSFGSIVVASALAAGLTVDAAILVNPISAPALEGPRGLLTKAAIAYYRLGARLPERAGRAWLSHPLIVRVMSISMAKTSDPVLRKFVHAQHDAYFSSFANRDALLEAFNTSVSNTVADVAEQIRVPLLLIAAERDDITPLSAQRELAARVPGADLRVIPRVGHLIHYETPAVAVSHMRDFVSSLP